jgi:beta-phosphoglucomutase-like phosphatase (HAD superfamily)
LTQPAIQQGVIFDWDGVIADSVPAYLLIYQQVCGRFGKRFPCADAEQFRGWYDARWERNFVDMGFAPDELREALLFAGRLAASMPEYRDVPLFAGAVRAVRELSRRVPLAIASTTHASLIRDRVQRAGLDGCFGAMVGGEGGGSDKVERYRRAAVAIGVEPASAIAVGDTAHDIEAAGHWGMRTVGVTYGWCSDERVCAAGPDRVVRSPDELEPTLLELLGLTRQEQEPASGGQS